MPFCKRNPNYCKILIKHVSTSINYGAIIFPCRLVVSFSALQISRSTVSMKVWQDMHAKFLPCPSHQPKSRTAWCRSSTRTSLKMLSLATKVCNINYKGTRYVRVWESTVPGLINKRPSLAPSQGLVMLSNENYVITGSDNGSASVQGQAFIRTIVGLLLSGPFGNEFQ